VNSETVTFGVGTIIPLVVLFYGATFWVSTRIGKKDENADDYMTAGHNIGFGISAASMTSTGDWAAYRYSTAP